jgi:hypothetical protein
VRSISYVLGYNDRIDAMPRKRPDKLKCKPGFEQRGAVCQPIKSKSNISKKESKNYLPAAASLVAASAAVSLAIRNASQKSKSKKDVPFPDLTHLLEVTKASKNKPDWVKGAIKGGKRSQQPTDKSRVSRREER